jgi:hypothetical protein
LVAAGGWSAIFHGPEYGRRPTEPSGKVPIARENRIRRQPIPNMVTLFGDQLRRAFCAAAILFSFCALESAHAQLTPRQYAVEATAVVQTAPAQVNLQWPGDANATGYTVSRKLPGATTWTTLTSLAGSATGYADGNVAIGGAYEYRIKKSSNLGITAFGYVLAGVDAPLVENRGKLVLVVDNTQSTPLATELGRLQQDLAGDGWTVIRKDVSRAATVASVKGLIKAEYDADRTNVKAVFLFGHVPVPRSGDINPDGHPNHQGAWAADTYYADMDGTWTDSTVNDMSAERSDNYNTPSDGKFDQSQIPSDLELAVGRVDLSNMTCFSNKTPSRSETDLLRAYLNKDHNFRHGLMNVPRRGVIADNFGDIYGESFASIPWANFAAMFGAGNTTALAYGTYFPTLKSQAYLFSYACGGGSYYTCDGIGGSDDFALNDIQAVFTSHFGSYFGDWDNESNFLRASLGSGNVLTTTWSGRPHYFYHHMALGETVGYSVRLSENNGSGGLYERVNMGSRYVNNGLMGDPTLRLHPVLAPSNLAGAAGNGLVLTWTGSSDTAIKGYHVYRAANANGPFTRLNSTLLGATTFTDAAPLAGGVYMVRAVKLESTPSGTYYNPSQGSFFTNNVQTPAPEPTNPSRFVKTDAVTGGNWKGIYGTQGYWMVGAPASLPSYASVATTAAQWTWASPSISLSALALPTSTSRIAACWYSATQIGFDLNVTDGQLHRVSLYFLDASYSGRQQRVDLVDRATGATLDSRSVSSFASGIYLTWEITGDVSIRVTPSVVNAVVSGVFFDGVPAPAPPASARFVKSDTSTRGSWKGVYGSEGYFMAAVPSAAPSYAAMATSAPQWTWEAQTTSPSALVLPGGSTTRVAACWYSSTQAAFDLAFSDGKSHRIAMYFLDASNSGRQQRVEILDSVSGAILDSRQLTNFSSGIYLVWDLTGRVVIRLTPSNVNAVTSGLFFDPSPTN